MLPRIPSGTGPATELVRRHVRESTVQTIPGHASPATTRIYVHKSAVEVADEYQDAFGAYLLQQHQRGLTVCERWLGVALLALVVLSGCSSGMATDARRDEARDASLPDKLASDQATRTAQRYFRQPRHPVPLSRTRQPWKNW